MVRVNAYRNGQWIGVVTGSKISPLTEDAYNFDYPALAVDAIEELREDYPDVTFQIEEM